MPKNYIAFILIFLSLLIISFVISFAVIRIISNSQDHILYDSAIIIDDEFHNIKVQFKSPKEINDVWQKGNNHSPEYDYKVSALSYKKDGSCIIIVPPPRDWNDHIILTKIGHEVLHCQGATHEKSL
jgi:hypothetical protein